MRSIDWGQLELEIDSREDNVEQDRRRPRNELAAEGTLTLLLIAQLSHRVFSTLHFTSEEVYNWWK